MEFETSLLASSHLPSNTITSTSSPLEVLSNAAALIETKSCDDYKSNFSTQQSMHSNTINKELPTKENKMKRTKDRRELAHTSSFRIKARSNSPPNDESITDRLDHSLSPSISPALNSHYTRTDLPENGNNALSCYTTYGQRDRDRNGSLTYRGSPYHQIGGTNNSNIIRRNSDPQSSASSDSIVEEDKPLDMSNKKYRNTDSTESQRSESRSEPSRSPPNSLSKLFGQQMMRPSVITCASSLLKSQTQQSSQSLSPTSKCHNCSTTDDLSQKCDNSDDCCVSDNNEDELSSSDNTAYNRNANNCKRHRREIVTEGVSDPVIEEHFRRSLGKDYSEIFSNSTNNTSITSNSVDDHFAKALGDTWVRLQKTTRIEESSKPNNAQSIAS